jgi:hypothetical protein
MSIVQPSPAVIGAIPGLYDILNAHIKHDIEEDPMIVWDKGVFLNELHKQGIVLTTDDNGAINGSLAARTGLRKGSYKGTRMALTEIYSLIEEAYGTPATSCPKTY